MDDVVGDTLLYLICKAMTSHEVKTPFPECMAYDFNRVRITIYYPPRNCHRWTVACGTGL
ncbi:MAG: hypothetical protein Tsb009_26560 [Planctomycetaceae bacterium]